MSFSGGFLEARRVECRIFSQELAKVSSSGGSLDLRDRSSEGKGVLKRCNGASVLIFDSVGMP